jgi:hypothetical protein
LSVKPILFAQLLIYVRKSFMRFCRVKLGLLEARLRPVEQLNREGEIGADLQGCVIDSLKVYLNDLILGKNKARFAPSFRAAAACHLPLK